MPSTVAGDSGVGCDSSPGDAQRNLRSMTQRETGATTQVSGTDHDCFPLKQCIHLICIIVVGCCPNAACAIINSQQLHSVSFSRRDRRNKSANILVQMSRQHKTSTSTQLRDSDDDQCSPHNKNRLLSLFVVVWLHHQQQPPNAQRVFFKKRQAEEKHNNSRAAVAATPYGNTDATEGHRQQLLPRPEQCNYLLSVFVVVVAPTQ